MLYGRLDHPPNSSPTEWIVDKLEAFWKWWSERYDPLPEPTDLRESCRRLRNALLKLRSVETPEVAVEDFTPRDFINAGDEHILDCLQGSEGQLRVGPLKDEIAEVRPNLPVRPTDMTKYDVPWANSWKAVLEIIEEHLERWSKVDDVVYLTNPFDCSEAYTRWGDGNGYYDVSLEVLYHTNSSMEIDATVWPPWKKETETIGFSARGTDFSKTAVNTFIVNALRDAGTSEPGS